MKKIPGMLINYNMYLSGGRLNGIVDVELPKFDAFTEEISGAGILGSYEEIVLGHFKSMTTKVNYRTPTNEMGLLLQQKEHLLEFRSAIQESKGTDKKAVGYHVTMMASPKVNELGKGEVGKPTGNSVELETTYILVIYDGVELLMLDKKNFIFRVYGVDQLKGVNDLI